MRPPCGLNGASGLVVVPLAPRTVHTLSTRVTPWNTGRGDRLPKPGRPHRAACIGRKGWAVRHRCPLRSPLPALAQPCLVIPAHHRPHCLSTIPPVLCNNTSTHARLPWWGRWCRTESHHCPQCWTPFRATTPATKPSITSAPYALRCRRRRRRQALVARSPLRLSHHHELLILPMSSRSPRAIPHRHRWPPTNPPIFPSPSHGRVASRPPADPSDREHRTGC